MKVYTGWAVKLLALAGLVFTVLWLISVIATGFRVSTWVPPTALLCDALALVLLAFPLP